MRWPASLLCFVALGCATQPTTSSSSASSASRSDPLVKDAAGSVRTPELRTLLEDHWRLVLTSSPLLATQLGVRAFDDQIDDLSLEAQKEHLQAQAELLIRAEDLLEVDLPPADATTLALLIEQLEVPLAEAPCRLSEWSLSPRNNPITTWNYLPELHTVSNLKDLKNLVARYIAIPTAIDQEIENLRSGARDGLYTNIESTRRVLAMVNTQLESPMASWPLIKPSQSRLPEGQEADGLRAQLSTLVRGQIRPALERYREVLAKEILPHARPNDQVGLIALKLGEECYSARIRHYTTLPLDAKTVHETGLREVERIDQAMAALGKKLFNIDDRLEVLAHLRSETSLHFETSEAIEAKAKSALERAERAIPKFFGRLPKASCVVRRIPDYEAPFTTIAYYRQPTPGVKPGEYFINVYKPKTRPRYEAEALAFHESIPGHHLQIAIAQELPALPSFRKNFGMTVFVEGWALYTEQLADEMGLYSADLDRMGMLSYEAWRASRLVVDTGIHAFGWSREQAAKFMLEHTALAANNIDNEVDRYIVWPGQAVAYKTGQMEIWRLRREAEKILGDSFSLPGFHDAILSGGAVTIPVLQKRIEEWVKTQSAIASH